ncbi:hypothetical protein R1sor_024538 [Riccia sorocarpa]|uniref:Uncharacterized protein n=1 Tax=Riccia sorocarpa TaxID=122646 RepID=A0ABD3GT09_9MARC
MVEVSSDGEGQKGKKDKKNRPTDVIDTTKFSAKTGLIDRASIQEYKSVYAQYQASNGAKVNSKLEEHVQTRLRNTVKEQKKKRKRDITSVAASTAASTAVPFSGIPIMVASTMVQCVGFSASLGLIPVANIRSIQDANTLASHMTSALQKASSSGLKAAVEAFVIEVLKNSGIGYWLWDEILKEIIYEMTSGAIIDSTWVLTPLFMAPKYHLHRKLIKKMYVALGEKAIVVHKAWVNEHLFLGKPETDQAADTPTSTPMVPSAYLNGYPTTGQTMYESNSDEGVPYPIYYQPAFAASTHRPAEAYPRHGNSLHQTGGKQGETVTNHPQSYDGGCIRDSYTSAPMYQQQMSTRESSQQEHQQPSLYKVSPYQSASAYPHQASTAGSSHYEHPESQQSHYNPNSHPSLPAYPQQAPTLGASQYTYQHLQSQPPSLPSRYPAGAEHGPHLKTSYRPPSDHYQHISSVNAAAENYPQKSPPQKQVEAC